MLRNSLFFYDLRFFIIRSPINLESKNDIGIFISFIKKSEIKERLILLPIFNSNLFLIKSIAVLPKNIINCPNRSNQIKFISWVLIPISTIAWVRNGNISIIILFTINPKAIWKKYFLYLKKYLNKKEDLDFTDIFFPHYLNRSSLLVPWPRPHLFHRYYLLNLTNGVEIL